jgi:hypothetical protein
VITTICNPLGPSGCCKQPYDKTMLRKTDPNTGFQTIKRLFQKPVQTPFLARLLRDRDRAISFFWLANRENVECKTPINLGLCLQQDAQTNQQTIREQAINADLQLTYCVSSSILYETGNARIRNCESSLATPLACATSVTVPDTWGCYSRGLYSCAHFRSQRTTKQG